MNPRPEDISLTKPACSPVARYTPARPQSSPQIAIAVYRSLITLTPAVSTASGFSPAARRRRPNRVRNITHQVSGTVRKPT